MTHLLLGLLFALQQQPSNARPGWPCVGRPDPSMVAVSEASGGQVFMLDPSEIAQSAALLTARDGHEHVLRRIAGEMEPGMQTTEVHVDGSVERALFSVSVQCLQTIEIERPSGAVVAAADPDVTWHAFQAGRLIGLRTPQAGTWHVRVAGKGLRLLAVHARARLGLDGVRPVRETGNPGQEGVVDDDTPLVAGTDRLIEVRLSPGLRGPGFEIRGADDSRLGTLSAVRVPADGAGHVYVSQVRVPGVPFRVVVTGRDTAGSTVQRAQESLFQVVRPE
jgi:hypothetical protein